MLHITCVPHTKRKTSERLVLRFIDEIRRNLVWKKKY